MFVLRVPLSPHTAETDALFSLIRADPSVCKVFDSKPPESEPPKSHSLFIGLGTHEDPLDNCELWLLHNDVAAANAGQLPRRTTNIMALAQTITKRYIYIDALCATQYSKAGDGYALFLAMAQHAAATAGLRGIRLTPKADVLYDVYRRKFGMDCPGAFCELLLPHRGIAPRYVAAYSLT